MVEAARHPIEALGPRLEGEDDSIPSSSNGCRIKHPTELGEETALVSLRYENYRPYSPHHKQVRKTQNSLS